MVDPKKSQPFSTFCFQLLDKIEAAGSVVEKKEIFGNYLQDWRVKYGVDYYDCLRLLMPVYSRRMYNLKEVTLANVILKALSISASAPDGVYLKNYKRPHGNAPSGIFHAAAYEVISTRSTVRSSSQTVRDLNELLDELDSKDELLEGKSADETINKKQVKIFKKMFDLYTPRQIQWIIRIILKDLKLQWSEQSILGVLHPNAKELYDAGRSLSELCQSIAKPRSEESSFSGVRLFSPCIPQSGFKGMSDNLEANINKLSKPFYSEQKLDGERMLMHYDPDQDRFAWFTRKKNDNTKRYGSSSSDHRKLSGHIYQGLPKRSIILDGEMVAYDPTVDGFLPFGTLKSTSVNSEGHTVESFNVNVDINDPTKPHPCYVVFDVLFYNGKSLINNPLKERLELLNIAVKNQNNHLKLIPRKELNTLEDIMKDLEEAIKNSWEGLVIKDPNSKYMLNSRLPSWIKFKPEYMDSMTENCDLLVVGSKFGSGKYGGIYRQLLCAVRDDKIPPEAPPRFITFAMVHSGMKDTEVNEFQKLMKQKEPYNPNRLPPWLDHPPRSNEIPDTLINYNDCIVAEIKGTEIIPSMQFGLSHTLRFPRFVKFRPDKGLDDVMTESEFRKAKQERRRGQKRNNEEEPEIAKKKGKRKVYSLLESQQGIDTRDIVVKSSLFENMIFYVMTGNKEYDKKDLELLIHENGGSFIQDAKEGVLIIGSDEDGTRKHARLTVFKEQKLWNVIRPQYIIDSVAKKDVLPLEPMYMYVTLDFKKQEFLKVMDEYGDYFTKLLKEDVTKTLLESMGNDDTQSEEKLRYKARQVARKYFNNEVEGMIFLNVVAYFDCNTSMPQDPLTPLTTERVKWKKLQEDMKIIQDRFEFDAGQVRTSTLDDEVTHVIVNQNDLTRLAALKNDFYRPKLPRFVTLEWIQACLNNHTLVNEMDYQPRIPNQL